MISTDRSIEYDEAMNKFYNSEVFEKLIDKETGLYLESPEYVYDLLNIDFICNRFETNRPSAEAVLEINPDIVAIGGIYQQYLLQQIKIEEPWNRIKGVVEGQLYNIPVGFVSFEQTAAESPLFIYDMANKLYPEFFDFDMISLTKECFSKYFSYQLTDSNANNILKGLDINGEPLIWKEQKNNLYFCRICNCSCNLVFCCFDGRKIYYWF